MERTTIVIIEAIYPAAIPDQLLTHSDIYLIIDTFRYLFICNL